MKTGTKVVLGCAFFAMLGFLCVGGLITVLISKASSSPRNKYEWQNVPQQIEATNKNYPFTTPTDHSIDAARYDVYIAVSNDLFKAWDELGFFRNVQRYREFITDLIDDNPNNNPKDGILTRVVMEEIKALPKYNAVTAKILENHQMSEREYFYHLTTTFEALNAMAQNDEKMKEVFELSTKSLADHDLMDLGGNEDSKEGMVLVSLGMDLEESEGKIPQATQDFIRQAFDSKKITPKSLGEEAGVAYLTNFNGIYKYTHLDNGESPTDSTLLGLLIETSTRETKKP